MYKLIILILLILLGVFLYLSKKYTNPYKLIMLFGKKGSGKTTYFTKLALKYISLGYPVYSNCEIYGTKLFNINDIGYKDFPENSVILIDEGKTIWDSRDFKNFDPKVRDWFIYLRHNKCICYISSQAFNIDKTLRDLCDELYLLTNVGNIFSIAKPINKKITIHTSDSTESFLTEDYKFYPFYKWKITFIPRYVEFFDSFVKKNLPEIDYKIPQFINNDLLQYISNNKNWIRLIYLQYKTLIQFYTNKAFYKLINKFKQFIICDYNFYKLIQYNFYF